MNKIFYSPAEASIFEDERVYVAFAKKPMAKGHVVVFWKKDVLDLHALARKDYEYLMDIVDMTRNAMLSVFRVSKVYLFYFDEIQHVHWHLIPRFKKKGAGILFETRKVQSDFSAAPKMRTAFKKARLEF